MREILTLLVVLTVAVVVADSAFAAANGDWIKPAEGLLGSLESGLVKIGTIVIGVGIIIVGLVAALTGKMEWKQFGYVVVGGLLVMAGPAALRALLANV